MSAHIIDTAAGYLIESYGHMPIIRYSLTDAIRYCHDNGIRIRGIK